MGFFGLVVIGVWVGGAFGVIPYSVSTVVVAAAFTYHLRQVRKQRFSRINELTRRLGYRGLSREEIYSKITLSDADIINQDFWQLEFPKIYTTALQFALFRTYAIPTISRILKKTKQLANPKFCGKRYSDTVVLIGEFTTWGVDSDRASLAIARMNYLHSLHPEILPCDTLYTLLLFATQPVEFISRYEWRNPTVLEEAACWKFWTEVGKRMKIPTEVIPSTFDAMVESYNAYEEKYMHPAETNHYVGKQTLRLLLYWVPTAAGRWLGEQIVFAVLDERLRTAMIFPKAKAWATYSVNVIIHVRRWYLKHLALPRKERVIRVRKDKEPNGKYTVNYADNEPWYVKRTLKNRLGIWGWVAWFGGWPIGGKEFHDDGYEIERIGPTSFENTGVEWCKKEKEEISRMAKSSNGGGCPLAFS